MKGLGKLVGIKGQAALATFLVDVLAAAKGLLPAKKRTRTSIMTLAAAVPSLGMLLISSFETANIMVDL